MKMTSTEVQALLSLRGMAVTGAFLWVGAQ
jgi:hypothetical protein